MAMGAIPSNMPAPVPTPFPPLKPAKTVQICPATAASPATICKLTGCQATPMAPMLSIQTTAIKPLAISTSNTTSPTFQPRILIAFVAPALPLPYWRISMPLNSLPATILVGNDPIRYDSRIIAIRWSIAHLFWFYAAECNSA